MLYLDLLNCVIILAMMVEAMWNWMDCKKRDEKTLSFIVLWLMFTFFRYISFIK